MAGNAAVRDPAFWRRFSVAVHNDEEIHPTSTTTSRKRPELNHSESWLDQQNRKKAKRNRLCWIFWLSFFAFVAGIVVLVLWLKASGVLNKIHIGKDDSADATTSATSTATASSSAATSTATNG